MSPDDRWEGYVAQREQVQAFVDEHAIDDVLWVTGDVHMCFVGQVDPEPTTPGQGMWEVCVTSGNINPLASSLPSDQFPWASGDAHLPVITFDPAAGEATVEFFASTGELAHSQVIALGDKS